MIEKNTITRSAENPEPAILVGIMTELQKVSQVEEYLDELEFLAETAGAITVKRFTQRLKHPDATTFIGSGKVLEIKAFLEQAEVNLVIFDDELSPTQLRNLEKALDCAILDRTALILDILHKEQRQLTRKLRSSWLNISICYRV
jgi:GTP-binding protein HflX